VDIRHSQILLGYFLYCVSCWPSNLQAQITPDTLPNFNFQGSNGDYVNRNQFDNGRPLILFYFDPTCSHCETQAVWVSEAIEKFQSVDLFWLVWEENETIEDFRNKHFQDANNVFFARDVSSIFDGLFGFSQIPSVFVFDGNNKLLKKFKSETKAQKLLNVLDL